MISRSRAKWKITPELGSYAGRNSGPLYELTYPVAPCVASRRMGDAYAPRAYVALKPSYVKGPIFHPTRGVFVIVPARSAT